MQQNSYKVLSTEDLQELLKATLENKISYTGTERLNAVNELITELRLRGRSQFDAFIETYCGFETLGEKVEKVKEAADCPASLIYLNLEPAVWKMNHHQAIILNSVQLSFILTRVFEKTIGLSAVLSTLRALHPRSSILPNLEPKMDAIEEEWLVEKEIGEVFSFIHEKYRKIKESK